MAQRVPPVGPRLRALRAQRGLSALQLARRASVPTRRIHAIEAGRTSPPVSTLSRVARGLGLPLFCLFVFPEEGFLHEHVDALRQTTLDALASMHHRRSIKTHAELAAIALRTPCRGSKLKALEREIILQALEHADGNASAAARLLGMERKSLLRKWEHFRSR